jgi:hypothetical protein
MNPFRSASLATNAHHLAARMGVKASPAFRQLLSEDDRVNFDAAPRWAQHAFLIAGFCGWGCSTGARFHPPDDPVCLERSEERSRDLRDRGMQWVYVPRSAAERAIAAGRLSPDAILDAGDGYVKTLQRIVTGPEGSLVVQVGAPVR